MLAGAALAFLTFKAPTGASLSRKLQHGLLQCRLSGRHLTPLSALSFYLAYVDYAAATAAAALAAGAGAGAGATAARTALITPGAGAGLPRQGRDLTEATCVREYHLGF